MKKFLVVLATLSFMNIAFANEEVVTTDTANKVEKEIVETVTQPVITETEVIEIAVLDVSNIKRAILSSSVENREPVDNLETFSVNDRAWLFNEIVDANEEKILYHQWSFYKDGVEIEMAKITLRAKGKRWRTWSNKKLYKEGNWSVKVLNESGDVLDKKDFFVKNIEVETVAEVTEITE